MNVLRGRRMTVVVRPASPIRTARDIQEKLRSDPASLNIAIGVSLAAPTTSPSRLSRARWCRRGQAEDGGIPVQFAGTDCAHGRTRGGCDVGITAERRGDGALAQVPTFKEQGLDVVFSNTRFLVGPRGMSGAQTAYWDNILARVVQTEEWKQDLLKDQSVPDYAGSRRAGERMAMLHRQLRGVLADAGLAKDDK